MSCSKWRWTPECDTHICVGDCDNCNYNLDEDVIEAVFNRGEVDMRGEE